MERIQICDECAYYESGELFCRLHQEDVDPLQNCEQWEACPTTENYRYGVDSPDAEDGFENGDAFTDGDNGDGGGEQADA